ncbi:hypothetical protein [Mesonia mobilis]|nr:hypothetical protein [Mesonia mobilis]
MALLKYHFFHSLGYFGNSDKIEPKAYLSSSKKIRKLTKIDLELLKYHYSYGICKGIGLKAFEEQHRRNKANLKKNPNSIQYILH